MKPKARTQSWCGLICWSTASVMLFVWIASGYLTFDCTLIEISEGDLTLKWSAATQSWHHWQLEWCQYKWNWLPQLSFNDRWLDPNPSGFRLRESGIVPREPQQVPLRRQHSGAYRLIIPLLPVAILIGLIGCIRFCWRQSPQDPCKCRRCGYILTGNTSGVCPECGTAITQ